MTKQLSLLAAVLEKVVAVKLGIGLGSSARWCTSPVARPSKVYSKVGGTYLAMANYLGGGSK